MNKGSCPKRTQSALILKDEKVWTENQRTELMRGVNVQTLDNADSGDEFENVIV